MYCTYDISFWCGVILQVILIFVGIVRMSFRVRLKILKALTEIPARMVDTTTGRRYSQWVAVCQMTSTNDRAKNQSICSSLINEAAAKGAQVIFLPECFDFVGESKDETLQLAETLEGSTIKRYKEIARNKVVWLSLGGFHEKVPGEMSVYNTHLMINPYGDMRSVYRKCHLFDVDMKETSFKESDCTTPGSAILPPVNTPIGNVGLQICYDLRFPEMSLVQRQQGADVLTYPSAFTTVTGMYHWHVLLRARAIENQCYVIAAAQTGRHNAKRSSYGHALIVDPWGTVVCECSEGNTFAMANIDLNLVDEVRAKMPVSNHRRHDLYNNPNKYP